MDILNAIIIIVIGFVSGFINTVAGGGSLLSLPVLIFMGLPGSVANATNRVAILSQNVFAVTGFNSKGIKLPVSYSVYLGIASLVGGFLGANLAVDIDDAVFNRILAVIMVLVVISMVAGRKVTLTGRPERLSARHQLVGVVSFFFLGIYGGFIQAGIGFLVIAVLTQVNHFGLVKTNYVKVFSALIYTVVAIVVFAVEGKIEWIMGLTLAVGQGFGGWYASRWSVDKGETWIKRVMVVAVTGLAIKLWFFT